MINVVLCKQMLEQLEQLEQDIRMLTEENRKLLAVIIQIMKDNETKSSTESELVSLDKIMVEVEQADQESVCSSGNVVDPIRIEEFTCDDASVC
jgi:hypothetical protein